MFRAIALSSFVGFALFLGACESPDTTAPEAPEVVPGEEAGELEAPVEEAAPEVEPVVPEGE